MIATSLISFSQAELQRIADANRPDAPAPSTLRKLALATAIMAIAAGVLMGLFAA